MSSNPCLRVGGEGVGPPGGEVTGSTVEEEARDVIVHV